MILLKILYRNTVLQEQMGHSGSTSLVRALSFPRSTKRNMLHRSNMIFHCFNNSFLSFVVKCKYKTFLWWRSSVYLCPVCSKVCDAPWRGHWRKWLKSLTWKCVCVVCDRHPQKAEKAAHVGNNYKGVLTVFCWISDVLVTAVDPLFSSINRLALLLFLREYCSR